MKRLSIPALLLLGCSGAPLPSLTDTEIKLVQPVVVDLLPESRPVVLVQFPGTTQRGESGVPMLLDTGADLTMLSRAGAENLGLYVAHFDGETVSFGAGGGTAPLTHYAAIDVLQIGELKAVAFHVPVSESEAYEGKAYVGVVGQDLFGRFATVFDMGEKKVHFLPASEDEGQVFEYLSQNNVGAGTWTIAPVEYSPRPHIRGEVVVLGELHEYPILIDTGAMASFLPQEFCEALKLESVGAQTYTGIDGSFEATKYKLEKFDLFGFNVSGEVSGTSHEFGILGIDVLAQFVLIQDKPNGRLWLHNRAVEPAGD